MPPRLKPAPIPRQPGVPDRTVHLSFAARFTDEILSGVPDVLMPTFRNHFGLSYAQVGLLQLALAYVAVVVEPVADLLIDIWRRRWLMAGGAAFIGAAVIIMGVAPTFLLLLLGFALYGVGSGPLAHTADVVLVETHPQAPGRIFTRATTIDTFGALLAPLLVSLTFWLNLPWRWLLVTLGAAALLYALLLIRTRFPLPPTAQQTTAGLSLSSRLRHNLRAVLANREARRWLLFLVTFSVLEAPLTFKTVWLNEQVGMSQALVGIYKALEMAVSLASLLYLDRWLSRTGQNRILQTATAGLLLLYPLWLLWPGIIARFLLGIPLNFLMSVYWPIARGQSLATVPGRAGALNAILSLWALVPLAPLFGVLAELTGLTRAMLLVSVGALLSLGLLARHLPS